MKKNKFVAERLGLIYRDHHGEHWYNKEIDFSIDTGAVQLLRLMEKNERYGEFVRFINGIEEGHLQDPRYDPLRYLIDTYYITTPGKLLDAAYEWFKKEKNK